MKKCILSVIEALLITVPLFILLHKYPERTSDDMRLLICGAVMLAVIACNCLSAMVDRISKKPETEIGLSLLFYELVKSFAVGFCIFFPSFYMLSVAIGMPMALQQLFLITVCGAIYHMLVHCFFEMHQNPNFLNFFQSDSSDN